MAKSNFIKNRTWLYLVPFIRFFDDKFINYFNSICKIQFGIYDQNMRIKKTLEKNCLYILVNKSINKESFLTFIEEIRKNKYYVTDYPYKNDFFGEKQMVVIKIPGRINDKFMFFIDGLYSKMWNEKEKTLLFKNDNKVFSILNRNSTSKSDYMKTLKKEFNVNEVNLPIKEYDVQPKYSEEVFNYKYKHIFINKENFLKYKKVRD